MMRREGLVSTACACASILQNLQNPNMYRYCGPVRLRTILRQKYTESLAHVHAVDTRPSLRIIEGLGMRLVTPLLTACTCDAVNYYNARMLSSVYIVAHSFCYSLAINSQ